MKLTITRRLPAVLLAGAAAFAIWSAAPAGASTMPTSTTPAYTYITVTGPHAVQPACVLPGNKDINGNPC